MGRDAFKPKHASSVPISGVIDTGVNNNKHLAVHHVDIPFTKCHNNRGDSIWNTTKLYSD